MIWDSANLGSSLAFLIILCGKLFLMVLLLCTFVFHINTMKKENEIQMEFGNDCIFHCVSGENKIPK